MIIIGAAGSLGRALFKKCKELDLDVVGTHYKSLDPNYRLDLSDPQLDRLPIDFELHQYAAITAAQSNLFLCEQEKELTHKNNVQGILSLASQLVARGITPILFSSDYVFDGLTGGYDEESKTCPINEYGRQKEEVEKRIEEVCGGNYLMLRCSKVYGLQEGDQSLMDQIATPLLYGEKIRAASDQIFTPIFLDDVVEVVLCLQKKACRGLYNVCGTEVWSRLELAKAIAKQLSRDETLIEEITLKDLNRPYGLPQRTNMSCEKLNSFIDLKLSALSECIKRYK